MGASSPTRGSAPGGHGSAVGRWAANRQLYLDNLKVLLIGAVIVGHAILGYSELDWWSYSDVREVTLSQVTAVVLLIIGGPLAFFMMPLLFLVAGLLTRSSVERKGSARFARDRVLRLGIPYVVFALLVWPYLEYALFRLLGTVTRSYPAYLREEGTLDTGVLWFVGALLVFSLGYAGWVALRQGRVRALSPAEITTGHLVAIVAAATLTTFAIRLAVPMETDTPLVDTHVWEWPTCAGVFGLGIVASRHGWLTAVPDRMRKQCRAVTIGAVGALGVFAGIGAASGALSDDDAWLGGWHWSALVLAGIEATVAVFASVWFLGAAQRHLNHEYRWAGPAVCRSAYGAFLLQGFTLFGLAAALRPVPVPAEVKALLVASGGVAASFALAWFLISRVRGVARIL